MTYRLRRADGVYRWVSVRAEPLRDESGRIVQWYGLAHDIDDQMRAEGGASAESEQQLQQMIDAVPVYILSFSADGGADLLQQAIPGLSWHYQSRTLTLYRNSNAR